MPVVRLTVKAAVLYFALVFAAGFVLGTIRTLWVAPSLGERNAQLTEAPLMVGLSFAAARWVSRRLALPDAATLRMGVGLLALALMLVIEFTVVLWIRGLTLDEYVARRDPVSGTAYILALGLFALMPLLAGRNSVH